MTLRVRRASCWLALGLLAVLALVGCEWDVGYQDYKDPTEAAAMINQGFLPDIFPASAKSIRLRMDHDMKYNGGQFRVAVADVAPLLARLQPGLPTTHPFAIDDEEWERLSADGFAPGMLDGSDGTAGPEASTATQWVISCNSGTGQCLYFGWPKNSPFLD